MLKMETKEEILDQQLYLSRVVTDGVPNEREYTLIAMERYANQRSAELQAAILEFRCKLKENLYKNSIPIAKDANIDNETLLAWERCGRMHISLGEYDEHFRITNIKAGN